MSWDWSLTFQLKSVYLPSTPQPLLFQPPHPHSPAPSGHTFMFKDGSWPIKVSLCNDTLPRLSLFSFEFFFFFFLVLHLWHMEVPRLGIKSELQLQAYTTATAMLDPSHVCDFHCSSQQCWSLLNPLMEAMEPESSWIQVRFLIHWATMGTSALLLLMHPLALWCWEPELEDHHGK